MFGKVLKMLQKFGRAIIEAFFAFQDIMWLAFFFLEYFSKLCSVGLLDPTFSLLLPSYLVFLAYLAS